MQHVQQRKARFEGIGNDDDGALGVSVTRMPTLRPEHEGLRTGAGMPTVKPPTKERVAMQRKLSFKRKQVGPKKEKGGQGEAGGGETPRSRSFLPSFLGARRSHKAETPSASPNAASSPPHVPFTEVVPRPLYTAALEKQAQAEAARAEAEARVAAIEQRHGGSSSGATELL